MRPAQRSRTATVLLSSLVAMAAATCTEGPVVDSPSAWLAVGDYDRALACIEERLASEVPKAPAYVQGLERQRSHALALAGDLGAGLAALPPGQPAKETHRLAEVLLEHGRPELALELADRGIANWPEHGAAFAHLGDAARLVLEPRLTELHGPVISRIWGYPIEDSCHHSVRYADGHVEAYDVPSR